MDFHCDDFGRSVFCSERVSTYFLCYSSEEAIIQTKSLENFMIMTLLHVKQPNSREKSGFLNKKL